VSSRDFLLVAVVCLTFYVLDLNVWNVKYRVLKKNFKIKMILDYVFVIFS
jgi:hypothetical protein